MVTINQQSISEKSSLNTHVNQQQHYPAPHCTHAHLTFTSNFYTYSTHDVLMEMLDECIKTSSMKALKEG